VAQEHIKPDLIEVGDLPIDLGRYRLHAILGTGGMARVFLADLIGPSGFRKRCALKVIHNRVAGQDSALHNALVNEARLGGLLHHPNIVDTYDFGDLEGQPFIAMEFIDGLPLDAILKVRGTLPLPVAVEAAIQICSGLDHAHNVKDDGVPAELVHRDLKPGNVMLTRNGTVKVLDFGIAKSLTAHGNTTAPGIAKGSPSYMSPEQVRAGAIDRRSDIFAMGAMLNSMATGEVLFAGDSLPSILMSIIEVDAHEQVQSKIDTLESHCPSLGGVVRRCLRADPGERFSTAAELGAELKQIRATLSGSTTLASFATSLFEEMDSIPLGANRASESIDGVWPTQTDFVAAGESAAGSGHASPGVAAEVSAHQGFPPLDLEYHLQSTRPQEAPKPLEASFAHQAVEPASASPSSTGLPAGDPATRPWSRPVLVATVVALVLMNGLYLAREPLSRFIESFLEPEVATLPGSSVQVATEVAEVSPGAEAQATVPVAAAAEPGQASQSGSETASGQAEERSEREKKRERHRARARESRAEKQLAKEASTRSTPAEGSAKKRSASTSSSAADSGDSRAVPADEVAATRAGTREKSRAGKTAGGSAPAAKLVIEPLELVREASVGSNPVFSIRVTGSSDISAVLRLRPEGGDWQQRKLNKATGSRWRTSFELKEQHRGLCHYYFQVEAGGDSPSRSTLGSKKYPYQLQVR